MRASEIPQGTEVRLDGEVLTVEGSFPTGPTYVEVQFLGFTRTFRYDAEIEVVR